MTIATPFRDVTARGYLQWSVADADASKSTLTAIAEGSLFYGLDTNKFYKVTGPATFVELVGTDTCLNTCSQLALRQFYPYGEAASVSFSPNTHGATVAYVYPFEVYSPLTVNQVAVRTAAALTNCLVLGIFNSAGAQVWASGAIGTAGAGWTTTTANLPVTMAPGQYYFATTNNNNTSGVTAFTGTPLTGTATMPRWGTVPASLGAMPASINPSAITKADLNFMVYVLLNNWT